MRPGCGGLGISWAVGGWNELNRLFGTDLMNDDAGLETLEQIKLMLLLHRLLTLTKTEVHWLEVGRRQPSEQEVWLLIEL